MKKILSVFAVVLFAASMMAEPFYVRVNGSTDYLATNTGEQDFQGRVQYAALGITLAQGDKLTCYDQGNSAAWNIGVIDQYGAYQNFATGSDALTCNVAGKYNVYIKMKMNDDMWYIEDAGGETPGPGPGGDDDDDVNYYAIGWINGADAGEAAYDVYDDNYLFRDGKLTIDCKMGSYIAVKDHMCNYYYSRTETTIANTQVTLDWANGWSGGQKWAIPEGVNYIIIRSASYKGSVQLERVDKATYDAYHWGSQGLDNTKVMPKGGKIIVDGELRIVHGDKVFDATGRQL